MLQAGDFIFQPGQAIWICGAAAGCRVRIRRRLPAARSIEKPVAGHVIPRRPHGQPGDDRWAVSIEEGHALAPKWSEQFGPSILDGGEVTA